MSNIEDIRNYGISQLWRFCDCFDDYFSTASLFLPGCTLTPLVGLEMVAPGEERNRFALAANFAHLRYPPSRQHTTCALFHSLRKELRAVSEGWLGRKGCRGIGNDLCRRDPRKPSLAGPSLLGEVLALGKNINEVLGSTMTENLVRKQ